jgi:hypothetical protein
VLGFPFRCRQHPRRDFKLQNAAMHGLRVEGADRISQLFASERNSEMTKTSSLSLVAAAALVATLGVAAPVLAEDDAGTSFNDDLVASALAERGINAVQLDENFGKIRATVQLADGSTEFQYFDIDTLQPIAASGGNGNSRVLSDLDVGVERAAPVGAQSLTWVDPDDQD